MPLNLSDGDFLPYLQYDSKAGRFFAKAEGERERKEIERPSLAFDMENVRTGWIRFPQDGGPEHVWDGSATDPSLKAPRPMGDGWKRGFEVLTYSNAQIPGSSVKLALRSFSSNASAVNAAFRKMYAEYEKQLPVNPNKVPVFVCKGVEATENQYGTVYAPVFELTVWVDSNKVPQFAEHAASRMQVLPPPKSGNGSGYAVPPMKRIAAEPVPADEFSDDIPF